MSQQRSLTDILDKSFTTTAKASVSGDNFDLENTHEEGEWLNFTIGVFFDGTNNNKYNTDEYLKAQADIDEINPLIQQEGKKIEKINKSLAKVKRELAEVNSDIFQLTDKKVYERQILEGSLIPKDNVVVHNTKKMSVASFKDAVNEPSLNPNKFELEPLIQKKELLEAQKKELEDGLYNSFKETNRLKKKQQDLFPSYMQDNESSYYNEYSNVAKLHDLYEGVEEVKDDESEENKIDFTFPVYVQGIGTSSKKDDHTTWGSGAGIGPTGVKAKVKDGCNDIADRIYEIFKEKEKAKIRLKSLTLDVFGFSRGAAAARHFVNEALKPYKSAQYGRYGESEDFQKEELAGGKLREAFIAKGLPWPLQVTVRFLGIFDTVVSVKFAKDPNINIESLEKTKVVHLTAQDEIRKYFPLSKAGIGKEYSFPGSHSDIGGSYPNGIMKVILQKVDNVNDIPRLKEKMQWYIKEGWFTKKEMSIVDGSIKYPLFIWPFPAEAPRVVSLKDNEIYLIGEKYFDNNYSIIPLSIMHKFAIEEGVPFNDFKDNERYQLHAGLKDIKNKLFQQVFNGNGPGLDEDDKVRLRKKYLHLSAHYQQTMWVIYPHKATPEGVRTILEVK